MFIEPIKNSCELLLINPLFVKSVPAVDANTILVVLKVEFELVNASEPLSIYEFSSNSRYYAVVEDVINSDTHLSLIVLSKYHD